MHYDAFDICEAYYLYFCHYHRGQGSRDYRRMSRMLSYFRPSPMLDYDRLSDNGRAIYDALTERATH